VHKSENRTSLGRAKLGAQIPARRDSAQFDAGASIKVECIFVKLADNLNMAIILCYLQTLSAGLWRPQGPRTNLPGAFASYEAA